jgi:hypothetical protein
MASQISANPNGTLTNGLTGFKRNNNTGYGNITILENHDASAASLSAT